MKPHQTMSGVVAAASNGCLELKTHQQHMLSKAKKKARWLNKKTVFPIPAEDALHRVSRCNANAVAGSFYGNQKRLQSGCTTGCKHGCMAYGTLGIRKTGTKSSSGTCTHLLPQRLFCNILSSCDL